jgi:hypothetical protein
VDAGEIRKQLPRSRVMITINHTVNLVAELDENNSTTKQLLALPSEEQVYMLENVFVDACKGVSLLEHLNEGNSFATIKFAEAE